MSRPIPEGVNPPNENTVILGYGGEFQVPRDGFDGWMRNAAAFDDEWVLCHGHGNNRFTIYAADRDSEVARVNRHGISRNESVRNSDVGKSLGCKCQSLAHKLNGDACDECNPKLALEHAMTTIKDLEAEAKDKDALIRELVQRWRAWSKPGNSEYDQGHYDRIAVCADELKATLARTTCPEAFEENQEQTQIDTK